MKISVLTIFTLVAFLFTSPVFGQRNCATHTNFQEQLASNPQFAERQGEIEAFTQQYVTDHKSRPFAQKGTAVYNIPVVFHIVYNNAQQNISDAQLQSQLDILNQDFQLNNTDAGKVPPAFKALMADCKIQFCLARRDPNGNPTNGIVRKATTVTSFSSNDNVKKAGLGGSDAWPANDYLNIWVCKLSGGLLGYAQFPGGPEATDGVVLNYTVVGNTGTAQAPFNLGRTGTHEVGHWLNLRHIWGDDGKACSGSDMVGDTPNQGDPNYGCPGFPTSSCNNGPNGDMFMNFMDYVDDACMQMFTPGQRDRMYAVLTTGGARSALSQSLGCQPPAVAVCNPPANLLATEVSQTTAAISWSASTSATQYTLQFKPEASGTYTSVLVNGTTKTLSGLLPGTTYSYQVKTNCTAESSSYSPVQTFTTNGTGCTDNYEPNNSLSSSLFIAMNTNITAIISSATDKDYFKITNSAAQKNIRIDLTNLPADYDIRLYNPYNVLVKASQNSGNNAETIIYNTSVIGTYKILVYGYDGAYNPQTCYTLKAQVSSGAFKNVPGKPNFKTVTQLYPVPASRDLNVHFEAEENEKTELIIINQLGAEVARKSVVVAPGANTSKLDVSSLPNGVYFLKISNGKAFKMEKIIVQH